MNTVDTAPLSTSAVPATLTPAAGSAAPVAALCSVQQVAPRSAYILDPERYSEVSNNNIDFWKVSSSIPIPTQSLEKQDWMGVASVNVRSVAKQPIGHYDFHNEAEIWRRRAPPAMLLKRFKLS